MTDCLFCKIIAGDIPGDFVLRTERSVAFRDINPQAPTHVLVVPIEHITNAADLSRGHGDLLSDLFDTANRVAEQEGVAERGYRLVFNVGEDALNSVPHLHLHVVGGRSMGWPPG